MMTTVAKDGGRLLALIPVLVGVLLAALLYPHESAPNDVPLPTIDTRTLDRAERVTPAPRADQETAFIAPLTNNGSVQTLAPFEIVAEPRTPSHVLRPQSTNILPTAPVYLTTTDELASALVACGKDSVVPQSIFSTTLTLQLGDDGSMKTATFTPPFVPEARDCAANVIWKRTKLANATGTITVPVEIR